MASKCIVLQIPENKRNSNDKLYSKDTNRYKKIKMNKERKLKLLLVRFLFFIFYYNKKVFFSYLFENRWE